MLGVNDEKDQSEYEMFDITKCANDIFVCSIAGCVNELFYCLLKKNLLYNKNVRTDNGQIIQFDINKITIQENTDYKEVATTIDTLNKDINLDGCLELCSEPFRNAVILIGC